MRIPVVVCAALLAASAAAQETRPALPASEAKKLRALFSDALAEPAGRAGAKLVAQAKTLEEKYELASLVAALREGPEYDKGSAKPRKVKGKEEKLSRFGSTTVGFTFESDGELYRYAVDVPPGYDEDRTSPLLVDPGHGSGANENDEGKAGFLGYFRNQVEEARLAGWLIARTEIVEQIGAGDVRGAKSEDQVARVFGDFFRDVASRFHVDLDRVYVSGLSQTGFWSWYLGRARADRLAGIAPMSAVTWQVDQYLENFSNLPAYVLHGAADLTCKVEQPRKTCAELEKLGSPVNYQELAGAAHDFAVWGHLDEGLAWLAERPRDPYPKKVAKSLQTELDPWCYWLRVDALEREGDGRAGTRPSASVEAAIEGQTVTIESEGVKRITLCLAPELLDLGSPVEVLWNGESVFTGAPERSFVRAVELALEKADWRGTFVAAIELKAPH